MVLTVLITLALVAVGVAHWRLSRMASPWWGAIVPALWLGACVAFLVTGNLDSLRTVGAVALAAVVLARIWAEGRRSRRPVEAPVR